MFLEDEEIISNSESSFFLVNTVNKSTLGLQISVVPRRKRSELPARITCVP